LPFQPIAASTSWRVARPALLDQRVTEHHKVNETELGSEIDERLRGARHPQPGEGDDLGSQADLVTADALALGSCATAWAADVGQRLIGHDAAPDAGCAVMADVGPEMADRQNGRCP